MNGKIQLLISIMLFTGLFVGGCAKAATTVPTATSTITPSPAPTLQPGDSQRTLTVGSLERTFLLYIPPGLDSLRPVPVVFAFHGQEDGLLMQLTTGLNDIADNNGFLVVYPKGTGSFDSALSWNAGGCCGTAMDNNIDDIAFVRQMLSDLGKIVRIDPKRIYATGFSNGAVFSYRLGCEMSDTFAAIAPVSGPLFYTPCQPKQPVSVVEVHGLKDTTVPYIGGMGDGGVTFPPVEQGIAAWVQLNGCTGAAQVEEKGIVMHTVYSSCRASTAVELYTIEGWSHAWPSPYYVFPTFSTQMIWDFFAAHPKP